jgi:hypothetical protein
VNIVLTYHPVPVFRRFPRCREPEKPGTCIFPCKKILRTEDQVRIGQHGSYPRFRELQKLPRQNGTQQEPNTPSFSSPTPTQLRRRETGILSGGSHVGANRNQTKDPERSSERSATNSSSRDQKCFLTRVTKKN